MFVNFLFSNKETLSQHWGERRNQSMMTRIVGLVKVALIGCLTLLSLVLLSFFAGFAVIIGFVGLSIMTVLSILMRKPMPVLVKQPTQKILHARKEGSSWIVY